jgi:hypothetical protein
VFRCVARRFRHGSIVTSRWRKPPNAQGFADHPPKSRI